MGYKISETSRSKGETDSVSKQETHDTSDKSDFKETRENAKIENTEKPLTRDSVEWQEFIESAKASKSEKTEETYSKPEAKKTLDTSSSGRSERTIDTSSSGRPERTIDTSSSGRPERKIDTTASGRDDRTVDKTKSATETSEKIETTEKGDKKTDSSKETAKETAKETKENDNSLDKKSEESMDEIDEDYEKALKGSEFIEDFEKRNGKDFLENQYESNKYVVIDRTRCRTDDTGMIYQIYNKEMGMYENIPENSYELNGYSYETDEECRIVNTTGFLKENNNEKRKGLTDKVKDKKEGDERGHIIADRFNASNLSGNLTAQSFDVNRKDYKALENHLDKLVNEENKEVFVDIDINYEGDSARPKEYIVNYYVDGERHRKKFLNN